MEAKAAAQIVKEIREHAKKENSSTYSGWYAGIAAKSKDALFNRHGVSEKGGWWIRRLATSNAEARTAERALHAVGFKGGPGGGLGNQVCLRLQDHGFHLRRLRWKVDQSEPGHLGCTFSVARHVPLGSPGNS